MNALIIFAAAIAGAWLSTWGFIPLFCKLGGLDVPNDRSSHKAPTPRGGGVGIIVGMVCGASMGWAIGEPLPGQALFIGTTLVAVTGFLDDYGVRIPVMGRLAVQMIGAGILIITAGELTQMPLPVPLDIALGFMGVPLTILWIVAVTNIYNFLDGIDGFAGLQGTIAALGIAFMAFIEGTSAVAVIGLAMAGSCVGFLAHNWHPARIFMGDVGSVTLGFLFAALPFEMQAVNRSAAVFSLILFLWFFLADGIVTFLQRMKRGERLWEAHCSHLYQRLVKTGLRHDQVALLILGPGAVLAGLNLVAVYIGGVTGRWAVLALAVTTLILQHLTVMKVGRN